MRTIAEKIHELLFLRGEVPPNADESRAYRDGTGDSLLASSVTAAQMARLGRDASYWQGWHDARPEALGADGSVLEDPTRPGGWCVKLDPRVCEDSPPPAAG